MKAREVSRPLLIWGMMGAGKTTLARHLSQDAGFVCIDLDGQIEREYGGSIAQLIERDGWDQFRAIEQSTLLNLLSKEEHDVIALGGGTLLNDDFRAQVRSVCTVVTLWAEVEILTRRIAQDSQVRPRLDGPENHDQSRILEVLSVRRDAYLDVDFLIDTSAVSMADLVQVFRDVFQAQVAA